MIPPQQEPVLNYFIMRRAIGVLGFALPLVVALGGYFLFASPLRETISDYYHTGMRDAFVGILCAIAVFLYCYTGYDWIDNFLTNIAGLAALGVAFFPTDETGPRTIVGSIHLITAGIFFFSLAIIALWLFRKSGPLIPATEQKQKRNVAYLLCGITILICLMLILGWKSKEMDERMAGFSVYRPIFWLESIAVWAFALSWLIKGQAILKDHPGEKKSG